MSIYIYIFKVLVVNKVLDGSHLLDFASNVQNDQNKRLFPLRQLFAMDNF